MLSFISFGPMAILLQYYNSHDTLTQSRTL